MGYLVHQMNRLKIVLLWALIGVSASNVEYISNKANIITKEKDVSILSHIFSIPMKRQFEYSSQSRELEIRKRSHGEKISCHFDDVESSRKLNVSSHTKCNETIIDVYHKNQSSFYRHSNHTSRSKKGKKRSRKHKKKSKKSKKKKKATKGKKKIVNPRNKEFQTKVDDLVISNFLASPTLHSDGLDLSLAPVFDSSGLPSSFYGDSTPTLPPKRRKHLNIEVFDDDELASSPGDSESKANSLAPYDYGSKVSPSPVVDSSGSQRPLHGDSTPPSSTPSVAKLTTASSLAPNDYSLTNSLLLSSANSMLAPIDDLNLPSLQPDLNDSNSSSPSSRPSVLNVSEPSWPSSNAEYASNLLTSSRTSSNVNSSIPSLAPSVIVSSSPSHFPSSTSSSLPSLTPSSIKSSIPSLAPSVIVSSSPSQFPSSTYSLLPSSTPSDTKSSLPSLTPSHFKSSSPSTAPTSSTSSIPSSTPSDSISLIPSSIPSSIPSLIPSLSMSSMPSLLPSGKTININAACKESIAPRGQYVDIFAATGQSNAWWPDGTYAFGRGVEDVLTSSGLFSNPTVVKNGAPGHGIAAWFIPNGPRRSYKAQFFSHGSGIKGSLELAIEKIIAEGNTPRFRGLFWFQGETDGEGEDWQLSTPSFIHIMIWDKMIAQIGIDVGSDNFFFVINTVGNSGPTINKTLKTIADADERGILFDTQRTPYRTDFSDVHGYDHFAVGQGNAQFFLDTFKDKLCDN